jgi:hypothetical protein
MVDESVRIVGFANGFSHPLYGHLSFSSWECEWKRRVCHPPSDVSLMVSVLLIFYKCFWLYEQHNYKYAKSLGRALIPRPAAYEAAALPG